MRRRGNPGFGLHCPSKRYKCLLRLLPRQQGAAASYIGERTHGGRLGQKHFSENRVIVCLHSGGIHLICKQRRKTILLSVLLLGLLSSKIRGQYA
jgi:hypothetical protein